MLKCDFCGYKFPESVLQRWPCESFWVRIPGTLPMHMEGDWAGCGPCSALVKAEDWDSLLIRCVTTFREINGMDWPYNFVCGQVSLIQQAFRAHRIKQ